MPYSLGWRVFAFAVLAIAASRIAIPFAQAEGSSVPALTQQELQAGVTDYLDQFPQLLAQTDAQLPPDAAKLTGKALVKVDIASNGRVLGTTIAQSSGQPVIDEFALEDVGQAHYPPFNARMPYKSFEFVVPVTVMPPPPSASNYAPNEGSMTGSSGLAAP